MRLISSWIVTIKSLKMGDVRCFMPQFCSVLVVFIQIHAEISAVAYNFDFILSLMISRASKSSTVVIITGFLLNLFLFSFSAVGFTSRV